MIGGGRSIRRVVLALFALSLGTSLALLFGYEAAVSSWLRGESALFGGLFKTPVSSARAYRNADLAARRFNVALLERPSRAVDPAFLAELAKDAAPLGIAVRRGESVDFSLPALDALETAALPSFGALEPEEPFSEGALAERALAVRQLDFIDGEGAAASFFVLRPPRPARPQQPYTRQLVLIASLLLLAADGAAGVYFIIRVTGPLKELENAAARMSAGDLETPLDAPRSGNGRFLELARVFEAFERMRSRIAELRAREREAEEGRRELIANLSHDLRTPLAAVRGYVEGLRDGVADTEEKRKRYLDTATAKIGTLDRMIGEILHLATLDSGGARSELASMDFRAFLASGVEELRLAIPEDEASILGEGLEGPPVFIRGDPRELRRLVENLVDNARKHSGKRPVSIRIKLALENGEALLRVEDDGAGIPPESRERVFERFYRGGQERPAGGTGLGLAIARRIAEGHGGSIRAEAAGNDGRAIGSGAGNAGGTEGGAGKGDGLGKGLGAGNGGNAILLRLPLAKA